MLAKKTLAALALLSMPVWAVTLQEMDGCLAVKNRWYSLEYSRGNSFSASILTGNGCRCLVIPYLYVDTEQEKYTGRKNPKPALVNRRSMPVAARVAKATETEVDLEVSFDFKGGKVREKIHFDDTPTIRYDISIDHSVRLHLHSLKLLADYGSAEAVFLPDGKRVAGYPVYGNVVRGQGWRGVSDPKCGLYATLGTLAQPLLAGLEYGMTGKREGKGTEHTEISVTSVPLAGRGKKGRVDFTYFLQVTCSPQQAVEAAEELFGKREAPFFFCYETEKLVTRPGEPNALLIEVRNNGASARTVKLRTLLHYGLDCECELDVRTLELAPRSRHPLQLPLEFPQAARPGLALRTELLDIGGKLLDSATDFCSVTDFAPRDTAFGLTNTNILNNEGMAEIQNSGFKRRYVGAYEYYCWAKSVIGGLAPGEESWTPNTEHHFDGTLTRKFVQEMVRDAHRKGIGVYAWITGLWNYHYAFRHPERLQYNKEGQPNIYGGAVYPDGRRRAVIKPHMFTVERADEWGREMADSIDMFGWDGCRWDWSFCPNMLSDPLFMGERAEDWYDWRGVPSSRLFADPDQTAVDCLRAWRKAVAERHPDFIYGTNYGSRPVLWKMNPKYKRESARDALTLFEDMGSYQRGEWCTFEKWGRELVRRIDEVRPFGAAPVVGFMSGLPPNSVSHNLARYLTIAAGIKWWDSNIISIDMPSDQVRNRFLLRYADYLYGTAFLHPKEVPVALRSPSRVLYEPFVRERKVNGGREILVPILNMPQDNEYICCRHDAPPVQKDLRLSMQLESDEKVIGVWLMSPQHPLKASRLSWNGAGVAIPELVDFALVLVQVKGERR